MLYVRGAASDFSPYGHQNEISKQANFNLYCSVARFARSLVSLGFIISITLIMVYPSIRKPERQSDGLRRTHYYFRCDKASSL